MRTTGRPTRSSALLTAMLLAVSLLAVAMAPAPPITRTPWEMHRDASPVGTISATMWPTHGHISAYAAASVPAADASTWGPAPNGEYIDFGHGGFSRLGGYPCRRAVDYTYFQTFVNVPPGGTVDEFRITFTGMDDGSRISVYNADHPGGLIVAGSYVYLSGGGTTDLAEFMIEGQNRVVITQVDDCWSGNQLRRADVVLNGSVVAPDPDTDGDTYVDPVDAFPLDPEEWGDNDGDGIGDNADPDDDNDGQSDADEAACGSDPLDGGSASADLDGDAEPDCVDDDRDGDGVPNDEDAYPDDGTRASADADDDGVDDDVDNCPAIPNADQADLDEDGLGDACDDDRDGDGVDNDEDAFPDDDGETTDTDGDGTGDNADTDDDGDGQSDDHEVACGSDSLDADSTSPDLDGDDVPDCVDPDDDGDGVDDGADNCARTTNADQADHDGDGVGDACDDDIDGDGVPNDVDAVPASDIAPDVAVAGCEPGVANAVTDSGETFNDLLAAAAAAATSHGDYVSTVADLSNGWKKAKLISGRQHGEIVSCAARSEVGKP